jgi:uncharacterized membrane protein
MRKILLILVFIFISPLVVHADADFYQDVYVQDNGDVLVKEAIALYGEYNGYEFNILYKYFDENQIYSADDFELVKVCESSFGKYALSPTNCFSKVNYANNGDSLVYTYREDTRSSTIRMYNPDSRGSSFYIEYKLKNVVVKHDDVAELRLNVLSTSFTEYLNKFNMNVYLPGKDSNMRAWAHGPLYGEIQRIDDERVLFTSTDIPSGKMVDIRMAFDKELIANSAKLSNKTMLDKIIEEETKLADEANKEREKIRKEEATYKMIVITISSLWFIGLIIIWIYVYKKYDKEYKSDFNEKYFRDFPGDYPPETVQYLMQKKVDTTGFSSSILNIIRKKGFTIEEIKKEKGLIFKKQEKDYKLTKSEEKESLTDNEKGLREWLLMYYGDGNQFEISAMREKIKDLTTAKAFMKRYNDWTNDCKREAIKEAFYEEHTSIKAFPILYAIIPIILMIFGLYQFGILIIPSIIFIIYITSFSRRTKKGNEHYKKWNALKNFLTDFGSFKDKELPEIHLWEKYLVYANVFGIAEKLRKDMEIKLQTIPDTDVTFNTFNYLYINHAINRSINQSVTSAVTAASSKIAASNNSSGGGFGGGWSGGGGFSGGGGTGGGRF